MNFLNMTPVADWNTLMNFADGYSDGKREINKTFPFLNESSREWAQRVGSRALMECMLHWNGVENIFNTYVSTANEAHQAEENPQTIIDFLKRMDTIIGNVVHKIERRSVTALCRQQVYGTITDDVVVLLDCSFDSDVRIQADEVLIVGGRPQGISVNGSGSVCILAPSVTFRNVSGRNVGISADHIQVEGVKSKNLVTANPTNDTEWDPKEAREIMSRIVDNLRDYQENWYEFQNEDDEDGIYREPPEEVVIDMPRMRGWGNRKQDEKMTSVNTENGEHVFRGRTVDPNLWSKLEQLPAEILAQILKEAKVAESEFAGMNAKDMVQILKGMALANPGRAAAMAQALNQVIQAYEEEHGKATSAMTDADVVMTADDWTNVSKLSNDKLQVILEAMGIAKDQTEGNSKKELISLMKGMTFGNSKLQNVIMAKYNELKA